MNIQNLKQLLRTSLFKSVEISIWQYLGQVSLLAWYIQSSALVNSFSPCKTKQMQGSLHLLLKKIK